MKMNMFSVLFIIALATCGGSSEALASITNEGANQLAANQTASTYHVVLIHGAWANAGGFSGVIRRLQSDGYTVDAPPNPLRGLASDSAYVAHFVRSVSGSIVLVGHSYGGAVITNAAFGNSSVKAQVFIYAFVPDAGESLVQLVSAKPGSALAAPPASVFNPDAPLRAARQSDNDVFSFDVWGTAVDRNGGPGDCIHGRTSGRRPWPIPARDSSPQSVNRLPQRWNLVRRKSSFAET